MGAELLGNMDEELNCTLRFLCISVKMALHAIIFDNYQSPSKTNVEGDSELNPACQQLFSAPIFNKNGFKCIKSCVDCQSLEKKLKGETKQKIHSVISHASNEQLNRVQVE